jgi:DNA-binding beta-propeller fold protein YncE
VVAVGGAPDALAIDPTAREVAVAVGDPARLVVLDVRTGRRKRAVAVPPGAGSAPSVFTIPDPTGARALAVAPTAAAGVGAVPAARRAPAPTAVAPAAAVVAGRTFVADPRTSTIVVLDGGRPTARFHVDVDPVALAAADGDHALAVVSGRERSLALYDPRTLKRLGRAPAGAGPAQVAAEEGRVYVTDPRGNALLTFAVHPHLALLRRTALPGRPYAIAADPVRHRLWVTLPATNQLVALSTTDPPRVLQRVPTVRQPDAVAVDTARGAVAIAAQHPGVVQLTVGARPPRARPAR